VPTASRASPIRPISGPPNALRGSCRSAAALQPPPGSSAWLVLPGWLQRTEVFLRCSSRSGPLPAHFVLRAAIDRICYPVPKTEAVD
jgi:hypothetical protein